MCFINTVWMDYNVTFIEHLSKELHFDFIHNHCIRLLIQALWVHMVIIKKRLCPTYRLPQLGTHEQLV